MNFSKGGVGSAANHPWCLHARRLSTLQWQGQSVQGRKHHHWETGPPERIAKAGLGGRGVRWELTGPGLLFILGLLDYTSKMQDSEPGRRPSEVFNQDTPCIPHQTTVNNSPVRSDFRTKYDLQSSQKPRIFWVMYATLSAFKLIKNPFPKSIFCSYYCNYHHYSTWKVKNIIKLEVKLFAATLCTKIALFTRRSKEDLSKH